MDTPSAPMDINLPPDDPRQEIPELSKKIKEKLIEIVRLGSSLADKPAYWDHVYVEEKPNPNPENKKGSATSSRLRVLLVLDEIAIDGGVEGYRSALNQIEREYHTVYKN